MGFTGQLDSQCVSYHLALERQRHRQSIPERDQVWVHIHQAGGSLAAMQLCSGISCALGKPYLIYSAS